MISLNCALAVLDCMSLPIPEDLKVLRERELERCRAEVTVVSSDDDEPCESRQRPTRPMRPIGQAVPSVSSSSSAAHSVAAAADSSSSSRKRLASQAIHSETGDDRGGDSDRFPLDSLDLDSQSQCSFGARTESHDNYDNGDGKNGFRRGRGSGRDASDETGDHESLRTIGALPNRNSGPGGASWKRNAGDDGDDSRQRGFGSYRKSQSFGSQRIQDLTSGSQDSQGSLGSGASEVAVLRRNKSQTFRLNQCADDLLQLDTQALQQFSKDTLCSMLQTLSLALGSKNEALNESKTVNRRLKRQCDQQEKNLASLRDLVGERSNGSLIKKVQRMILSSSLELSTTSSGKRLTAESSLAVGIRRCFSNIAAADFGATVLMSISQQTVCRCEVKAASASRGAFQFHLAECLEQARQISMSPDSNLFSVLGISIRADATNSGIWRREKLHVCEIAVGYTDSYHDPDFGNTSFAIHRHLYLGFLLRPLGPLGPVAGTYVFLASMLLHCFIFICLFFNYVMVD